MFCAVCSADIDIDKKKEVIAMWFETDMVDLKVRKESGEDLLQLAKKNGLYDYIV